MSEPAGDGPKLSKVEAYKEESLGLAGKIQETWMGDATHFEEGDAALLKHHGSYQQDNRDARAERRKEGLDKAWIFMVRNKIPGGRMTSEQYLFEDELSNRYTYGNQRITSRQGIQFHGVGKEYLKGIIKTINEIGLSTLGACGDVNRNTLACPVCDLDWRHALDMDGLASKIAAHFAPQSTAYYEIWCDGEKVGQKVAPTREEPIYGKTYLPRKFKMGVGVPEDNCVDLYTHDCGIEVVHENGKLIAYDLLVGGGMGFNHSKKETYPRLGSRICRVQPDEILQALENVVKIQRDFGDRTDRNHARIKYTIDDRGVDWFREELHRRMGRELPDAGPMPKYHIHDHLGWNEDRHGNLHLGIRVDNGRIQDLPDNRTKSGLKEIISRFRPGIRLTPQQNIILTGIDPKLQNEIDTLVSDFGMWTDRNIAPLRRRSMACPALPTCGLALADSERTLPAILDEVERLGSGASQIELRMTGCPNSCVRTPNAEIGISGRGPGKYVMHIGGSTEGNRLGYLFRESVNEPDMPQLLHQLIQAWHGGAQESESFGDWSMRLGREGVDALLLGSPVSAS